MKNQKKEIPLKVIKKGSIIKGHHTPSGCGMGSFDGSTLVKEEENKEYSDEAFLKK